MSVKKTHVVLIVCALVLFVLLFIAPKIAPKHTDGDGHDHSGKSKNLSSDATLDVYLNLALKNLEPNKKVLYDKFLSIKEIDSIIVFWDKLKRPDLAAHFTEELAKKENNAANWLKAGNRYYYAIQFVQDKTAIPILYQSATRCFGKGLELEPNNVDAKIMLASCYVEGSEDPMEGIKRLREIEKIDSNNVKLQLTFAFFSVKSGQLDKAISRFNNVLKIDSNYIEAYLHLADAYEQKNDTEKTIEMLEKYSAKTTDVTARIEINKYIQQLKNKN
ncbi:MAG: tetratricopeptide repeat protein [Bacteroidota bacterium]|nr:tetratricopeptide repeat protein [Bacteroidota bacterium]MDP3147027.1 tetratricopeptide repeat protein [Bacteroidota bacterium]